MTEAPPRTERRVVMFVRNPCTNDVRVLREAATLHEAGWDVTIMALQPGGDRELPYEEHRDGVRILRVPTPGGWRVWRTIRFFPWRSIRTLRDQFLDEVRAGPSHWFRATRLGFGLVLLFPFAAVRAGLVAAGRPPTPPRGDDSLSWLIRWRYSFLGWADAVASVAPRADVYHGHDLTGLPAALRARNRHGGGGRVVYDSHELFLEAGSTARQADWAKRVLGSLERRWIRASDAVITVNDSIAEELHDRYDAPTAVIIRNTPPRQPVPDPRPNTLRRAAAIPDAAPVVLYHGGFQRDRGLDVLAMAMLEPPVAGAHLCYLGFGPLLETLEGLARDPRYGGRLHVLPGVPPEELEEWVASADVSAMPNQPRTLNERYSTPNKLFESIAVGTPVVGSDFPERRRIVLDDPDGPLGVVCDPTDPKIIAEALAQVLDLPPDAAADLRRRCQKAAWERWNWELQTERLLELYEGLVPQPVAASG